MTTPTLTPPSGQPSTDGRKVPVTLFIAARDLPLYEAMKGLYNLDDSAFVSDGTAALLFLFRNGLFTRQASLLEEVVGSFIDQGILRDRVDTQVSNAEKLRIDALAILGTLKKRLDDLSVPPVGGGS